MVLQHVGVIQFAYHVCQLSQWELLAKKKHFHNNKSLIKHQQKPDWTLDLPLIYSSTIAGSFLIILKIENEKIRKL